VRIGICEWTTFPASFEEELPAYRAAGAGAIGILAVESMEAPPVRRPVTPGPLTRKKRL
jgi:hypothetical protein